MSTRNDAERKAFAALERLSSAWADGANLTQAVAIILTHDDRESRLEAFIKQAFEEGVYCARHSLGPDDVRAFAAGDLDEEPSP